MLRSFALGLFGLCFSTICFASPCDFDCTWYANEPQGHHVQKDFHVTVNDETELAPVIVPLGTVSGLKLQARFSNADQPEFRGPYVMEIWKVEGSSFTLLVSGDLDHKNAVQYQGEVQFTELYCRG